MNILFLQSQDWLLPHFLYMTHTLEHITPEEYASWSSEIHHDLAYSTEGSKRISIYFNGRIKVTTDVWEWKTRNIVVHIDTDNINDAIDVYNSL